MTAKIIKLFFKTHLKFIFNVRIIYINSVSKQLNHQRDGFSQQKIHHSRLRSSPHKSNTQLNVTTPHKHDVIHIAVQCPVG